MAHINGQIRAAVAAALTGLPTTGARVDQDFLTVRNIAEPRLLVKVSTDSVNTDFSGLQRRALRVAVAGYAKDAASSGVLDGIQSEVEVAMKNAGALGGLLSGDMEFQDDDRDIYFDTLEKPAGFVTLIFGAECFTRAGQPETAA